jgi:hypothetical protein
MRKHCATPFIAVETGENKILGYYTLSPSAIVIGDIPEKLLNTISRYRKVPSILLGRLAVNKIKTLTCTVEFALFNSVYSL